MGMKKIFVLILGLFSVGCSKKVGNLPEKIYVPGDEFIQKLTISVSEKVVQAGGTITLNAMRESNGFIEIDSKDLKGECYFISAPPRIEDDVSLNINWIISPNDKSFQFSVDDSGSRTVIFKNAGLYKLKAHSSLWCPPGMSSEELEIHVLAEP